MELEWNARGGKKAAAMGNAQRVSPPWLPAALRRWGWRPWFGVPLEVLQGL